MDERQETAVDDNIKAIIACIQTNLTNMLLDFVNNGGGPPEMRIFSVDDIDNIEGKGIPKAQTQELIRMLKLRDQGFTALTTALTQYGSGDLADKLKQESNHTSNFSSEGTASSSRSRLTEEHSEVKAKAYHRKHAKLPKPWNAPYRQQRFVGRNNFLQHLDKLQNASSKESEHLSHSTYIIAACVGLGGIGKSSIALQFIYQNLERYEYVFWIPATTCEEIKHCLTKLGAQLRLPISNNAQICEETVFWLQANPGWLMVFDDAPNFSMIEPYIPCTGGHTLVTSRYTEWPCQTLNITPFTNEETTEYVQLILPSAVDKTECAALAEALGNLPLAISQATAYMSKLRICVPEYLVKFKAAQQQLLSSTILPPDCKSKSVYFTWNVSVEKAKLECGFAAELLAFCSLLDCNNVPENLICEFAKLRNCSTVLEEAQAALFSYSLMSVSSSPRRGLSMHLLIQVVTKATLSNDSVIEYLKEALICIEKVWPSEPKINHNDVREIYPILNKCLHYIKLEGEAVEEQPQSLMLHVQHEILSIAKKAYIILGYHQLQYAHLKRMNKSAKYSGAIPCNELLAAKLWHDLGNAYGQMGNYKKQKQHLTNAFKMKVKHYGFDHTTVAATLHCLGNAYGSLGKYKKQKELLKKALEIREKHYGINHTKVAATLHSLANMYLNFGNYHRAKELNNKTLVIIEEYYGSDHAEVAITLNNMGHMYLRLGNYPKAKELHEKALLLLQRHYGPDHTMVAEARHHLGNVFYYLGNYHKARDLYETALVIREKHYRPDHAEVAVSSHCLGNAYSSLGDYHKAKELLEKVLVIRVAHYGPDHAEVAATNHCLGNVNFNFGDYHKARELLEKALVIREKHYGPGHAEVALTIHCLGNAYSSLGDYHKARELYEKALKISEKHYGPDHVVVAFTVHALGKVYYSLGNYHKARELLEKALVIREKHYGPDHAVVAVTIHCLGNVYSSLGNYQKARELLEKALVIKEKQYGPDHAEVAVTIHCLGNVYSSLGNYQKARKLLEKALVIKEKHYGPDHAEVAVTIHCLVHYQKARELLEKVLVIKEKHYRPDHAEVVVTRLPLSVSVLWRKKCEFCSYDSSKMTLLGVEHLS